MLQSEHSYSNFVEMNHTLHECLLCYITPGNTGQYPPERTIGSNEPYNIASNKYANIMPHTNPYKSLAVIKTYSEFTTCIYYDCSFARVITLKK